MSYLKLEYWNSCNIAGLLYQFGYHNIMYLDLDAGKPTIETIEEGVEDGEKNFISHFTKMVKKYKIETILPEYQFDAINFASMNDYKEITLNNGEVSRCLTFQVENKGWDKNGADVQVEISFSVDYIIKTNCCEQLVELTKCRTCEFTPAGMILRTSTKYTDPFKTGSGAVPNKIYLIYNTLTGACTIEQLNTALVWVTPEKANYESICYDDGSIYWRWYKDNSGYYRVYQYMDVPNINGNIATVKCFALPNTWVQMYTSINGVNYVKYGSPVYANISKNGIDVTISGGIKYLKFYLFDNNCNYGYSNVRII